MTTATSEIAVIQTLTGQMEVLNTRSDDAGTAYRAGQREVRKYKAQGYRGELVGVVAAEEDMAIEYEGEYLGRTSEGLSVRDHRTTYVKRTFYRPVISPPCPTGE
jgi:hypothetical protein